MFQFLQNNLIEIILLAAIALCVLLAIRKIVKDKKAGVGPCGSKCSECSKANYCEHIKKQ